MSDLETLGAFYFTAAWCKPCQSFKPLATKILNDSNIPVQFVDIDAEPELSAGFGVMSVPTVVFTRGSLEATRTVGAWPEAKFREIVKNLG